ncbi:MAG: isoprenylcysteine carboxylmethyltransferase family protein [Bacteroidota bacterium]
MKFKIPPPFVFLISFGLLKLIDFVNDDFVIHLPYQVIISSVFILLGVAAGVLGILEFRKHKTTVDPSDPNKASTIVTTSIYRFTRNPMYLGMALVLFGIIIRYGNPLTLVSIVFLVWYLTQFQIKPEEEILKEKFGESYQDYLEKVRRWV